MASGSRPEAPGTACQDPRALPRGRRRSVALRDRRAQLPRGDVPRHASCYLLTSWRPPQHALVDGNRLPLGLPWPATVVIRGDSRSASIAAASIIAKTHRDDIWLGSTPSSPGMATKEHYEAISRLGLTHHRRTFQGVLRCARWGAAGELNPSFRIESPAS